MRRIKKIKSRGVLGTGLKLQSIYILPLASALDMKARSPEYRLFMSVNFTMPKEEKKIKKFIEEE